MTTLLFDSPDLVCFSAGSGPGCVVTFGAWRGKGLKGVPYTKVPGFGRHAIESIGCEGIHIVPRRNHWFQTPDILPVLEAVRQRVAGRPIVTYGNSMGGYGAINFAEHLGARFLAFSPQFTLDPARMPNETRWRKDTRGLQWNYDFIVNGTNAQGLVLFDPMMEDSHHASLIAAHSRAGLIPCRYSAHEVARHINLTYGLKRLLADFVADRISVSHLQAERRANRTLDPDYVAHLYAATIGSAHRSQRYYAIGTLFRSHSGTALPSRLRVVTALRRAGMTKEAHEIADQVWKSELIKQGDRITACRILLNAGRPRKALIRLNELATEYPDLKPVRRLMRRAKHMMQVARRRKLAAKAG